MVKKKKIGSITHAKRTITWTFIYYSLKLSVVRAARYGFIRDFIKLVNLWIRAGTIWPEIHIAIY